MLREDYLIRLIEQAADFLARIAGHDRKREYEEAVDEAGRAWDELLGVPRAIVEVTDSQTLAGLLRDPAKMRVAARLLAAEAHALRARRDPVVSTMLYRRALELALEARALEPAEDDEKLVLELSREVPPSTIDARYR